MTEPRPQLRPLLASLLVLSVCLLVYGQLLDPGRVPASAHSDFVAQHLATKTLIRTALGEGRAPYWRSDQLGGFPALTNPQAGCFAPLQALFLLMAPARALGPTYFLHFAVAGLAFFALGGALGLGFWSRALMAVAGATSLKLQMAAYAGWVPVLGSIVLLPLILQAFLRALESPGLKSSAWLGLVLAGALAAGQPQLVYYFAMLLGSWALIRLVRLGVAGDGRALVRVSWSLGLGIVLAAASVAVVFLPVALELPLLGRTSPPLEYLLNEHAFRWELMGTFFYPELLGTPLDGSYAPIELWEDSAYFGLVPLGFAVIGLLRPGIGRSLGLLAAFAFVLCWDTPLLRAAYLVLPGFSLFRGPNRFLFLVATLGIALAGVGFELVLRKAEPRGLKPRMIALVLMLAMSLEGLYYSRRYLGGADPASLLPDPELALRLGPSREKGRTATFDRETLAYGWAALLGVELVGGYDPVNYRHYQSYLTLIEEGRYRAAHAGPWFDLRALRRLDALDALNVGQLLSRRPLEVAEGRIAAVAELEEQRIFRFYEGVERATLHLYENRQARSWVFWASRVWPVPDEQSLENALALADLASDAVVLSSGSVPGSTSGGRLELLSRSAGALELEAEPDHAGFLVVSEVWHPGWSALVDGSSAPLYRTNGALIGIAVPGGAHRISLRFTPPGFWIGSVVSLVGLLACGLAFLLDRRAGPSRAG